eukprot:COSAG06_NODE_7081_length_2641_cov_6.252950_1_plen_273_part_00
MSTLQATVLKLGGRKHTSWQSRACRLDVAGLSWKKGTTSGDSSGHNIPRSQIEWVLAATTEDEGRGQPASRVLMIQCHSTHKGGKRYFLALPTEAERDVWVRALSPEQGVTVCLATRHLKAAVPDAEARVQMAGRFLTHPAVMKQEREKRLGFLLEGHPETGFPAILTTEEEVEQAQQYAAHILSTELCHVGRVDGGISDCAKCAEIRMLSLKGTGLDPSTLGMDFNPSTKPDDTADTTKTVVPGTHGRLAVDEKKLAHDQFNTATPALVPT